MEAVITVCTPPPPPPPVLEEEIGLWFVFAFVRNGLPPPTPPLECSGTSGLKSTDPSDSSSRFRARETTARGDDVGIELEVGPIVARGGDERCRKDEVGFISKTEDDRGEREKKVE